MRHFQAILAIVALLAVPLALFAHGEACQKPKCACCMSHGSNTQGKHMMCTHCAGQNPCGMSATVPDYGLNSPMAPTITQAFFVLLQPNMGREAVSHFASSHATGFPFLPFEPPRA